MMGAVVVLAFLSGAFILMRVIEWVIVLQRESKRFARTVDEFHREVTRGRR